MELPPIPPSPNNVPAIKLGRAFTKKVEPELDLSGEVIACRVIALPESMLNVPRATVDFFSTYMEFAKASASPKIYHKWVALSTIASAVERKVYLDWEYTKIYPNMFIFLVGDSGAKKGTALNVAKPLLLKAKIEKAPTMVTPEDFFKRMAEQAVRYVSEENQDKLLVAQTPYTVIADELGVFFGGDIDKFIRALTDIYDCREVGDPWHYSTKHQGDSYMESQWLNFLAGTTPAYIKKSLPAHARDEGFLGRVINVYSEAVKITQGLPPSMLYKAGLIKEDETHSMQTHLDDKAKIEEMLVGDLIQMKKLHGAMDITAETLVAYNAWFNDHEHKVFNNTFHLSKELFGGYISRRSTTLRKMMMLFSIARSNALLITIEDFEQARDLLYQTELKMPRVFNGMPRDYSHEEVLKILLHTFWAAWTEKDADVKEIVITKQTLIRNYMEAIDIEAMEKALKHLDQGGMVIPAGINLMGTGDFGLRLTDHGLESCKTLFSET